MHNECATNGSNISNKLDYLFGMASGNQHNIDRSLSMLAQMERIGLPDNPTNRAILFDHLVNVSHDASNIINNNAGRVTRESLLMGPTGGVKLKTVWEGEKLITIFVNGKGSRFNHIP